MSLVEALYRDHEAILEHLRQSQPSFHGYLEGSLPKVLLLAAASEFEHRLLGHLEDFFDEKTASNHPTLSFLRIKGMTRQYHTYFKWDPPPNAGPFFSLFGQAFKVYAKERQREDLRFAQAVQDFLVIGSLRNQLVHGNYAAFSLDRTSAEIYALYESAGYFIDSLPEMLRRDLAADGQGKEADDS